MVRRREKSGGVLSGIFRRSPKPAQNCADGQGDGSSDITEKKERADETPSIPPRPSEEGAGSSDSTEKKARADETPHVPPRPSEEELRNSITHCPSMNPTDVDHNQDSLSVDGESHSSSADFSEKSGGVLKGFFRRSPKPAQNYADGQDSLSVDGKLHSSNADHSKKSGGVLSGIFRCSPKPAQNCADGQVGETSGDGSSDITEKKNQADETPPVPPRPSEEELRNSITYRLSVNPTDTDHNQDSLSVDGESHSSSADLSEKSGGVLSGFFRRSPKPAQNCADGQGDGSSDITEKKERADETPSIPPRPSEEDSLSVDGESHSSSADLPEKSGGVLKGFFSRSPKPVRNCADGQDSGASVNKQQVKEGEDEGRQDSLSVDGESHSSSADLSEKSGGVLSGFFRRSPKPAQNCADGQGDGSSDITEKKERADETPSIPPRPSEEDSLSVDGESHSSSSSSSADLSEKSGGVLSGFFRRFPKPAQNCTDDQGAGSSDITKKKAKIDETPHVLPRPSEEELRNSITPRLSVTPADTDHNQDSGVSVSEQQVKGSEDEGCQMEDQEVSQRTEDDSDECVNEAAAADEKEKPKKKKVKKKKNPFMLHVTPKSKMIQKISGEDGTEALEKSLMEQLNEFGLNPVHSEDEEDLDSLMEWWSTVEQWEPTSKQEDMTEKEEARAFALTAEKVQRGIRVFNQLFSERAEALWQHIIDLNHIADGLDRFNKRTKVAQITGGSTSAVGGVATITGLALAPVTMGTSLIVTAVGLGVAAAGGLTSATAGISNTVHGSIDRKKVEHIVKDFQSKMADIDKCTRFIKRGIENLRELNAPKVKQLKRYESDVSGVNDIYEDGAMAGKAVLINANEITKFTQVAMTAGGTAARAVQVAAMATGILTGLFVAMDVYFVAKDSKELKKGAKSEFAKKIREVAEQLHQGLVELNVIREELQSSESSETSMSSISSPSASTCTTSLTSSSSTSGISSSSTSISSLSSTSTSSSSFSSPSQNTEAHIEPQAQS
ncbi:nucleolar protein dao-5-like isoform X4 [Neoarius graeffei]|uniref:nucleolar protein dao-5-like isoform X4 n=1 Tax=Neoarius graeffei TaxID=443677 RepID=UPI00298D46DE|nr:nucleolar protein dao-5-like isoform X4 [Neoarius graeffei]